MVSADGAGAAVTSTGASLFWATAGAPRTSISAADATLRDLILMRRKAVILPALLVAGFIRTHRPLRRARQPAIRAQIAPAQGFTDVGRVNRHQFHASFRRDVTGSTVLPQLTKVGRGFIRIMRCRQPQHHDLLVGQRPYRPRRRSYDQTSRFEYLSLSHKCAGSDDALRTDHCAIQDLRAHTDQRFILHHAAVEDRLMPDGYRAPMVNGAPGSEWPIAPSCKFVSSPSRIGVLSARITAPNQTLARGPRRTSPMTSAEGATQAVGSIDGDVSPRQ